MIKHILLILLFEFVFLSIQGQIPEEVSKPDYFDESLHLHVISEVLSSDFSLQRQHNQSSKKNISENILDYPYKSDIISSDLKSLEDKKTILTLIKKYVELKEYSQASLLMQNISSSDLEHEEHDTYQFLKGYLSFVFKQFEKARLVFDHKNSAKSSFKFEHLYYSAFCDMFSGDYESSYEKFAQLQNQSRYQNDLPYYMALTKYQLDEYDEVISILKNELSYSKSIYEDAMRELLSRAYYKESKWNQLSEVLLSDNGCCDSEEQHYFVGLSLYKRGEWNEAIPHLTESTNMNTSESQNALLALGSIYFKRDPKIAIPMFIEAASMNYDIDLKDQALLALGKVYQTTNQTDLAISSLRRIKKDSKHFPESQSEVLKILYHRQDFEQALAVLDDINKSLRDEEMYQEILLRIGIKHYEKRKYNQALSFLMKASQSQVDYSKASRAAHMIARIHFAQENWNQLNNVIVVYENINSKRPTRNIHTDSEVYYLKAYSRLKTQDFPSAILAFQDAEEALKKAFKVKTQPQHEKMYEDILLRKADCYFKLGNKQKALSQYALAYDYHINHGDYALYQKGKVEDLMREPFLQISTYDLLEKKFPNSKYLIDSWIKKGQVLVQMNKEKEAYDQFAKVYKSIKSNHFQKYEALSKLGLITYNQGDIETALSFYKEIFDNDEIDNIKKEETLLVIEEIYLKDLKDSESYYAFLDNIDLNPRSTMNRDSIDYHLAIESLKEERSQGVNALNRYLDSHKNGQYRVVSLKEMAKTYEVLEDSQNAIQTYYQLISEAPQSKEMALMRIIHILSKYESKIDQFILANKELLQENYSKQKNDIAYANIAKASIKINEILEYDKHISIALRGNELNNNEKDAIRLALVKAYVSQQKYELSKKHLDILSSSKNHTIAGESLLIVAQRLLQLGKHDAAFAASEASLERYKSDRNFVAKVILVQAQIYFEKGDLQAASTALESIMSQNDLKIETLRTADELLDLIRKEGKVQYEKANPTLNLQYGDHE